MPRARFNWHSIALAAAAVGLAVLAIVLFTAGGDDENGDAGEAAAASDKSLGRLRSNNGFTLRVNPRRPPSKQLVDLSLTIRGEDGKPVTDFEVEHDKRLHLILVRNDLSGYQHVHPRMNDRGVWHQQLFLPDAGPYRVYADFKSDGKKTVLSAPVAARGDYAPRPLPGAEKVALLDGGYRVRLERKRDSGEVLFRISRNGRPVDDLQDYLGAKGHLVMVRKSDLAYLHTHPEDSSDSDAIRFVVHFPSRGRYRAFLQFRHRDRVRTAEFTVGGAPAKGGAGGHEHHG